MKHFLLVIWLWMLSCSAAAELRIYVAAGERQLDIFRKELPQQEDDAHYIGFGLGAYRAISPRWSAGAAVEILNPISRDQEIGSGRILGFRPVNLATQFGSLRAEAYGGVAQYDWVKKAAGYYLGLNLATAIADSDFAIGIDYKYFQDLAHDAPEAENIVDGPALSLQLSYKID